MTLTLTIALLGLHLNAVPPQDTIDCIGQFRFNGRIEDLENGYCDFRDRWVPGLITEGTHDRPAPPYTKGNVVWYNIGVMEQTAKEMGVDLSAYKDGIALMSCSDFGATVWLKRPGYEWEGPFISIDCSHRVHMYPNIYYGGEVAEIGFKTATEWGMTALDAEGKRIVHSWSMSEVEVYKGSTPPGPELVPVNYVLWWMENAKFTNGYRFN